MRKIINILTLIFVISSISLIFVIATFGIKTSKFNDLISQKINKNNKNLSTKLNDIKFKLDIKNFSLFLETKNPEIDYRNTLIPTKNLKVYIDFFSIFKTDTNIKKAHIILNQIDINRLKRLSLSFKPSNFKSFINNKVKAGSINAEVEVFFNKRNLIDNFIIKGLVTNFQTDITKDLSLDKTNFSFFSDKSDLLIKNFDGVSSFFKIKDGDLKFKFSPKISLEANFNTDINYEKKNGDLPMSLFLKNNFSKNLIKINANLVNHVKIDLDTTYKVKDFKYRNSGNISAAIFEDKNLLQTKFLNEKIIFLSLLNSEIKSDYSPQKKNIKISGKYSLNQNELLPYNLENTSKNQFQNLKISADFNRALNFEIINYQKIKGKNAKIFLDLTKKKNDLEINEFNYNEGKSSISLNNLKIKNNLFSSFEKIKIITFKENLKNNDFSIFYNKKFIVDGNQFDATNLLRYLNKKSEKKPFFNFNKEIEIKLSNITVPLSEKIKNFKLIGKLEKGKFSKISSKGDFGNNNFLDVTMRNDATNNKKYLEIYSDKTKPFLTEYSFFEGLTGGKLLFTSLINNDGSYDAILKIEDFKVINAPGMVKLLTIADLGGLADLAKGEGISFDILEINLSKTKNLLSISEILALGPSISVLMEGYQDEQVTSLRGSLVPAKTLNKLISKIPVIGDIVIPKEVGEGLFGISFKMKGPPGKIKTSINPIRTLTPRFIQKIVDKNKKIK